jgi:hypothetical protein
LYDQVTSYASVHDEQSGMVTTRESRHAASSRIDPRLSGLPVDNDHQTLSAALTNPLYQTATGNQFAGLVEAATAAAGQETEWSQGEDVEAILACHEQMQQQIGSYASHVPMPSRMPQLNGSEVDYKYPIEGLQETPKPNPRKRKRASSPKEQQVRFEGDLEGRELQSQQALAEARAAGVHSSAALFREKSSAGKKSTRLSMREMYEGLEVTPEGFLHLQAAAKGYILDDNHPERRECVGKRENGDGDMAKLNLWKCVEAFLDENDVGGRFFGQPLMEDGVTPRTLVWPMEQQKVIQKVIHLCRRMVTNERQRKYAVKVRKGGQDAKKAIDNDNNEELKNPPSQHLSDSQDPYEDPNMSSTNNFLPQSKTKEAVTPQSALILQVSILHKGRRYAPKLVLASEATPDLASLRGKVGEHLIKNGKNSMEGHQVDV